jgi:hypothetical protein
VGRVGCVGRGLGFRLEFSEISPPGITGGNEDPAVLHPRFALYAVCCALRVLALIFALNRLEGAAL